MANHEGRNGKGAEYGILALSTDKVLKEKRKLFIQSVNKGSIKVLLDELLEKKVLNQEEMESIIDENPTVMDKARALIDSVIRKGPRACEICVNHICEEDSIIAEKLGLSPASSAMKDCTTQLTFSGPKGSLKLCLPETAQRILKEKPDEIYPIKERLTRTRLALIICNMDFEILPRRTGADVDLRGMKMLLEELGYKVDVRENLTATDMTSVLMEFAARKEHENSDSAFLVFMSHGIRDGICGTKYSENMADILDVNTIFQLLNTRNCPKLKDKPKVIIIQACRGENQGVVWFKDSVKISADADHDSMAPKTFEDDAIKKAHIEKDFIAFCSSTPDNVSWRHPTLGSIFIIKLIEYLQEYSCSCHLEEIFRKIQRSFEMPESKTQMPTTERVTLTRYFYLFPGY
ncbi:caspase-1 [Orycteropus afer afer]|uniref:Caspase-1 n=1 Tax=Orycteropus afer afer TaxID=1230840 RepID=A0A8B7A8A8_ORYAF|nr:caspase-1 [Orycteropus afer afer]